MQALVPYRFTSLIKYFVGHIKLCGVGGGMVIITYKYTFMNELWNLLIHVPSVHVYLPMWPSYRNPFEAYGDHRVIAWKSIDGRVTWIFTSRHTNYIYNIGLRSKWCVTDLSFLCTILSVQTTTKIFHPLMSIESLKE